MAQILFPFLLSLFINSNYSDWQKCSIQYQFNVHKKGTILATIIALHEDEKTAIDAFRSLPDAAPFVLYQIGQSANRLMKLRCGSKEYFFDPNRIFTKQGIIKTLEKLNNTYPKALEIRLQQMALKIVKKMVNRNTSGYFLALHNNREAGLSVITYQNSVDAAAVHIAPGQDPDNFFIVTRKKDFLFFKEENENVVLKSTTPTDDGSLSVYCVANNIPYINIEAQHGHTEKQAAMLLLCEKLLKKRN